MADPIVDANVSHQIYVERLAKTNANTLDPKLRKLATYVRARLAEEGDRITSKAAMNRVVKDIKREFGGTYDAWINQTEGFTRDLGTYETGFQTEILEASTTDNYTAKKPSDKSTREEVESTPMAIGANGGAVAVAAMLGNYSRNEVQRATALVETGFIQGQTTNQISSAIAGTRAQNFEDGVIISAKRNATAISRTVSDHVTNTAKTNVYKANEKAVQGYILTAVLDSKTTKQCKAWDDTKIRDDASYQPKPPFHVNCRTVMLAWLVDDLDAIKQTSRQTIGADGKKFESTKKQYYSWLKEQPAWFQDEALGKTEGKIFRNAGLSTSEFKKATVNRSGEPLNLKEMAAGDKRIAKYLAT
jgi:SPP1 gp7 family putative phage head morphogenesis protein